MDRKAQHFWDWVAGMSHAPKRLGRVPRRVVATAGRHLSPESVVLDVGCGPGDVTVAIAARVACMAAPGPWARRKPHPSPTGRAPRSPSDA